jgi:hypothetical protein
MLTGKIPKPMYGDGCITNAPGCSGSGAGAHQDESNLIFKFANIVLH